MKKVRLIVNLLLISILFSNISVLASTKVNIRTESNYLVPNGIIVDDSNKNDVLSTPAIDVSEKIYDFAEVLTDMEEEKLYKQIQTFIKETSMDLAIVTVKDNPIDNTQNFAHNFYNYNSFKSDGSLFLVDFEQGSIYMTTHGRAYELFPDSRIQPVLENVYKKILSKQYYDACSTFINSISGFVGIGKVEKGEDIVIDVDGTVHKQSIVVQALVFAFIGTIIIMLILISMNKMVKPATSSRDFLDKESVIIDGLSEIRVSTKTVKR